MDETTTRKRRTAQKNTEEVAEKTISRQSSSRTTHLVGLDIGFGELKRVSNTFPEPVVIPSAVMAGAKPNAGRLFELDEIDDSALVVTTEEGTFFVGEQAMNIPSNVSKRTQVRDRASDQISRVLFQTGIALSVPHEEGEYDVYVVTGVPSEDYGLSVRRNLIEFLDGSFEVTFHLSGDKSITKQINVIGFDILRQPEGTVTYHQFRFDPENVMVPSERARRWIGVIDFGHFTTDFALFESGVCVDDDTLSGSTVGVTAVYRRLKTKLIRKFDEMGFQFLPTDKDLDMAIRTGLINYMGREHDVTEEVKEAAVSIAKDISKDVLDSWGNETNRLEIIIATGGGATLFEEYVAKEFQARKKQGFVVMEDSQFSNVLGFYLYGCFSLAMEYGSEVVYDEYVAPVFEGVV